MPKYLVKVKHKGKTHKVRVLAPSEKDAREAIKRNPARYAK